jgi:hypothetical protein
MKVNLWLSVGMPLSCLASTLLFLTMTKAVAADPPLPVVVELFTSEGCSSCPPAEAWLRTLDKQPIQGVEAIVLEEHVDYWDDLGWRDPFSSHNVTLRQIGYVRRFRGDGPYTPQMVVAGAYEFTGSDRQRAADALEKARTLPMVPVRVSSVRVENGRLRARVETGSVPEKTDVLAALALEHAESQVLRGENGGHHLEHVAVVTGLTRIGKTEKGQAYAGDVSLDARSVPQSGRIIIFLQEPGQGKIVGAAVGHF